MRDVREILFVHIPICPQIVCVGGLETEAINTRVPFVTLWFPGYCGFVDLNGCVSSHYVHALCFFAI